MRYRETKSEKEITFVIEIRPNELNYVCDAKYYRGGSKTKIKKNV